MSAVDRVKEWLSLGALVAPDPARAGTVHLSRALAALCGVADGVDPTTRDLAERIGESEHLVFVLADGLGSALLERLDQGSFLRRHLDRELRAVFPAATASAITALATGEWPARHGVPGWWIYLAEHDLSVTSLPFIERFSGEPLEDRGLTTDVYPCAPLIPRYARATLTVQPQRIYDSAYSRYLRGQRPTVGYDTLETGVDAVVAHAATSSGPTFSYLYIPEVDHAAHHHGPASEEVAREMIRVDACVERLAGQLAGRARIVLSADHGLVHVPEDRKHTICKGDDLMAFLAAPPSGEPRVPLFHVRPGEEAGFRAAFEERLGERWALLTVDEVEALGLFGPGSLGPETRARLGTFVAMTEGVDVILYRPGAAVEGTEKLLGYHGGLLPDEVRVPLVLA